jgi:hypothetical protein
MNNKKEPNYESVDIDSELADLRSKFDNTPVSEVDTSSELLAKHDQATNKNIVSEINRTSFPRIELPISPSLVIREKAPAQYEVITEITTARSNATDQIDQPSQLPQNLKGTDANSMLESVENVVQPISNIEDYDDNNLLDQREEVLYDLLLKMGQQIKVDRLNSQVTQTPQTETTETIVSEDDALDIAGEVFGEGLKDENPAEPLRFTMPPPITGFQTTILSKPGLITPSNQLIVETKIEPYTPPAVFPREGEIPLPLLLQEMRGLYNGAIKNPAIPFGVVTSLSMAWAGFSLLNNMNKPKDAPKVVESQQGEVKSDTKPEDKSEALETKPEKGLFISEKEFQERYVRFYQAMKRIELKDPKALVGLYRAQDINLKKKHFYPINTVNAILNADPSKISTLTIDKTKVKITPTGKLFALSLGPTESDMEPNKQGGVVFTKKDVTVPFYQPNKEACFGLIQLCLPISAGRTYEEILTPLTTDKKPPSPDEYKKDLSLQIGVATGAFDLKSNRALDFMPWRKKIVYGDEIDFAQKVASAANGWIGFCPVPKAERDPMPYLPKDETERNKIILNNYYPKDRTTLATLGRNCGGGVPGVDYAKSSRINMEMFLGDGITVIVNGKKQRIQF